MHQHGMTSLPARLAALPMLAMTLLLTLGVAMPGGVGAVSAATLDSVDYSVLPGERIQITMQLSEAIGEPLSFATDEPPRIALDFPGTALALASRRLAIDVGKVQSLTAIEAGGRSRVVVNLDATAAYEVAVNGAEVTLTIDNTSAGSRSAASGRQPSARAASRAGRTSIDNVDFRLGEDGAGRVVVTLGDPNTNIDTREVGRNIVVNFSNVDLPAELERTLDVTDFATPVTNVRVARAGRNVRMTIATTGTYDHLVYQSDRVFSVDVRRLTASEVEEVQRDRFAFTGERLSLNFQSIEVRAVLQLLADFTDLNIVASDTVNGSLTLRLKNVPWDQALDIILRTKGLAKRQDGNVVLVAPIAELAEREQKEAEAKAIFTELAPLDTQVIQINYAKARDIHELVSAASKFTSETDRSTDLGIGLRSNSLNLQSRSNRSSSSGFVDQGGLLSARGRSSFDERTNQMFVTDTRESVAAIREFVARLDVPVKQVMVESRIVIADESFNRDLGIRWGVSGTKNAVADGVLFGGTNGTGNSISTGGTGTDRVPFRPGISSPDSEGTPYIVDLPIGNPAASLGLAIIDLPNFLIQLELQALQQENRGEVLSNPRVVTADGSKARIEQGTEIPFQEASSSGATSTSFKKAVLALDVTPQITPDNKVLLDLNISQDAPGAETNGIPAVATRRVQTQVMVNNGDTVVLGGIFEQTKREDATKVPLFGDLPYLGALFRSTSVRDDRSELLIFVTPKILDDQLNPG